MFYLIITVFIAELIILLSVLSFIIRKDKFVCNLTDKIEKRRNILKWRLYVLADITSGINEIIPKLISKARKTRRNIIIRYVNELLQFTVLLFFKPKYKKIVLGSKTGINLVRKILKV